MKSLIIVVFLTQLYSCYCQDGDSTPMLTPPMPTIPPSKSTIMMVPPSPTLPPTDGRSAPPSPSVSGTTIPITAGPTITPSDDCLDRKDDCRNYGASACTGLYESWAKFNCPRYCGYCVNPNDTNVECVDKLSNCNEFQSDMCTDDIYRLFVEDNCRKYCNKCDSKPSVNAGSGVINAKPSLSPDAIAANINGIECKDTVDYCWTEPDANCFGIYEPWARGHCPYRCFFCDEKPPCEDKLDYCNQYDSNTCTSPNFINWARLNCRKTCNLCDPPVPPPSMGGTTSGNQGQGGSGTTSSPVAPSSNPVGVPTKPNQPGGTGSNTGTGNTNITIPTGTVINGAKNTFIIQGPPPQIDGTCYYKGESHLQDKNWYDGCDYVCNCLDAKRNRIICTERCNSWMNTDVKLDGCSWVQESGDCCQRLECNVNK